MKKCWSNRIVMGEVFGLCGYCAISTLEFRTQKVTRDCLLSGTLKVSETCNWYKAGQALQAIPGISGIYRVFPVES